VNSHPGIEDLLPGLEDLFGPGGSQGLEGLPGLDELLNDMFGFDELPPELQQLLEDLLGVPAPAPQGGEGA
jgi:hypothetical protein